MSNKYVQLKDSDGNNLFPIVAGSKVSYDDITGQIEEEAVLTEEKVVSTGIEITKIPTGNGLNQALSLTGMEVIMNYSDGSSEVLSSGITTDPVAGTIITNNPAKVNVIYTNSTKTYRTSFNIELSSEGLEIVSWADGTEAQLNAMVEAAYAGDIDLRDYWSVGDTRTVSLDAMTSQYGIETHAAQDVEFTLMDANCSGFLINGAETKPMFIVGMKNVLQEPITTEPVSIEETWSESKRRSWANDTFRYALPSGFRKLFKKFDWTVWNITDFTEATTTKTSGSTTYSLTPPSYTVASENVTDYFGFPCKTHVLGSSNNIRYSNTLFPRVYYYGSVQEYWRYFNYSDLTLTDLPYVTSSFPSYAKFLKSSEYADISLLHNSSTATVDSYFEEEVSKYGEAWAWYQNSANISKTINGTDVKWYGISPTYLTHSCLYSSSYTYIQARSSRSRINFINSIGQGLWYNNISIASFSSNSDGIYVNSSDTTSNYSYFTAGASGGNITYSCDKNNYLSLFGVI